MAQRKKRKSQTPPRSVNPLLGQNTVHYAKARVAVRKYFRIYGLDTWFLDSLTKKQDWALYAPYVSSTRVRAAPGHRVPRQHLRYLSSEISNYLHANNFRDDSIGLTLEDAFRYGIAFVASMDVALDTLNTIALFSPAQCARIEELRKFFNEKEVINDLSIVREPIQQAVISISKINLRIYGYTSKVPGEFSNGSYAPTFLFSSREPTATRFTYNGIERTAYLVQTGLRDGDEPYIATIPRRLLDPAEPDEDACHEIYIQTHALQRVKERVDAFSASRRNLISMGSILYLDEDTGFTDDRAMIKCMCLDTDGTPVTFGYFPFIIDDGRLIILTFLTPAFLSTPDGDLLHERLSLRKEDTRHIGMDKLSFFSQVDFSQIPTLQKAFEGTCIPGMLAYFDKHRDKKESAIDPKKTEMVKKFFEQKAAFDRGNTFT